MGERESIQRLVDAIKLVEDNYPLPRCPHGGALRDHAGDILEPTCGCRLNEVFLDPDYRREPPKEGRYCVRCQKPLKDSTPFVNVTCHYDRMRVWLGGKDLMGKDCAKRIGLIKPAPGTVGATK